jgi:4-amino-4-deoxy-L-arabinose transferase-like glycosyltransferase
MSSRVSFDAAGHDLPDGPGLRPALADGRAPQDTRLARLGRFLTTPDGIAVLSLAVLVAVVFATFRDYGLGWDDYTHSQMGDLVLSLYGSGFRDQRALSFVNLYYYGSGPDILAALAAKVLPFDLFETRRLVDALIGVVGIVAAWRIARRVAGPRAGLVALLLLATCPIYFGHMFINAKDAPFAAAMTVLLLGIVRLFEEYPKPSPVTVLLFGCGLGAAIGTRVIAVITVIPVLLALLLLLLLDLRRITFRAALARLSRFAFSVLPGLALAYLVMGLLWPWSIISPLNPLRAAEYFSVFFEKPWREVFEGRLIEVPDMPASYLPTLLSLQLPEILLALFAIGVAIAAIWTMRAALSPQRRAIALLLIASALAPIILAIATRPAMYNGFRHFLFLLPAFAVLGGIASAWLWERSARLGRPALATAATIAAIGFISPVIEMVRLHPYEYTHFNHIEGGVKSAENEFMLDYWGLSFKQAAQQLRERLAERMETPPKGRRWRIAVCGPHAPAAVELGPEFEPTWDISKADFALMLGTYYCLQLPAPVLAHVEREGVNYARAYDVRERSFSTLFAVPHL